MFNVASELDGIRRARDESRIRQLLAAALTGAIATDALEGPDANSLFIAAQAHGVLGLFPLRHPQFQTAVLGARANGLRALRLTRRVTGAIEAAGIPVVVLKGAAAASGWADPTLRQQSDVDVLVAPAHKDAAARALLDAGVCSKRFLDSVEMHNDSLLPADKGGLLVELHHDLSNHHDTRVAVEELLARRRRVATPQGDLPALDRDDDAVYLALHATTHALQRLAWLVDLAGLGPSWETAATRARAWGLGLAVAPAWTRARDVLGVGISQRAMGLLGLPRAQLLVASTVLRATDATGGDVHRFFERLFRLSVVPVRALPRVVRRKLAARREEHDAYERLEADA